MIKWNICTRITMEIIHQYQSSIWLFIGLVLVTLELVMLPGTGLLFLGVGSVVTSVTLHYYTELGLVTQLSILGLSSTMCLLVLWHPIKRFVDRSTVNQNFNIVGSKVKIISRKNKNNKYGQVLWSGTVMNAEFVHDSDVCEIHDYVEVIDVRGNALICDKISRR